MASPQFEEGHVKIANEIMDELSHITLQSREWNILIFVFRKTYGWNKRFDYISLSQFRKGCRINQSQVCKILKSLVSRKILLKTENGYGFNKNYEEWGSITRDTPVSPVSSITADNKVVSQQTIYPVSPVILTKDTITKDTIQKTYIPSQKLSEDFGYDFELTKLTEQELTKLSKKFGSDLAGILTQFENSLGANGYKYKSHYRAILKWFDKPKTMDFYQKEYENMNCNSAAFAKKYGLEMLKKLLTSHQ